MKTNDKNEPPPVNPHAYRKMRQAQRNMMIRFFKRGRKQRRIRLKWARQMQKWSDKMLEDKR